MERFIFDTSSHTLVCGILNITPDSFSDGGKWDEPQKALEHALEMQALGADIIDVGAQSTRPGSTRLSADEENARLIPVLDLLKGRITGEQPLLRPGNRLCKKLRGQPAPDKGYREDKDRRQRADVRRVAKARYRHGIGRDRRRKARPGNGGAAHGEHIERRRYYPRPRCVLRRPVGARRGRTEKDIRGGKRWIR